MPGNVSNDLSVFVCYRMLELSIIGDQHCTRAEGPKLVRGAANILADNKYVK